MDETHTKVTLLISADVDDDIASARSFADKVLDIFADWSSPETDIPADTPTTAGSVN